MTQDAADGGVDQAVAVITEYLASIEAAADEDEAADIYSDGLDVVVGRQVWMLSLSDDGWEVQRAHVTEEDHLEVGEDDGEPWTVCGSNTSPTRLVALLVAVGR